MSKPLILLLTLMGGLMPAAYAVAAHLGPDDIAALPVRQPLLTSHYGPSPLQSGELRMPEGPGPFPLAILIHGGCFTRGFATLQYMRPLADDLAHRGVATWNVEYRQLGDRGGGWPGSFEDWAAASDHVRRLARLQPIDLSRVLAIGHSAGATAALWVATRTQLPSWNRLRGRDPLPIAATVAIDGPVDLAAWIGTDAQVCHAPVVSQLFGGTPSTRSFRYDWGDPGRLPFPAGPLLLVASMVLPEADAIRYRQRPRPGGDHVHTLALSDAGHFDMLAPSQDSYRLMVDEIIALAGANAERGTRR